MPWTQANFSKQWLKLTKKKEVMKQLLRTFPYFSLCSPLSKLCSGHLQVSLIRKFNLDLLSLRRGTGSKVLRFHHLPVHMPTCSLLCLIHHYLTEFVCFHWGFFNLPFLLRGCNPALNPNPEHSQPKKNAFHSLIHGNLWLKENETSSGEIWKLKTHEMTPKQMGRTPKKSGWKRRKQTGGSPNPWNLTLLNPD